MKGINCYNCKHRGGLFKIDSLTHCHCEHPKMKDEKSPWETLHEFWDKCDDFERLKEESK